MIQHLKGIGIRKNLVDMKNLVDTVIIYTHSAYV